jgi:DNA-binding transcriptional MerR regulator
VRVGEVAERAGVNIETLRYYERRGLLPAPQRAPSGHRRYDEETVRFLRAIKEAQAVGFTLAEIAEYLRAARRSTAPSETLRVRMAAKIDDIDARIAALRRLRDELARVVGCDLQLARSLHLRRRLSRKTRKGAGYASATAARHQRRERRQHPAPDRDRRRRAALAGRTP